jgi:hypothetical protein
MPPIRSKSDPSTKRGQMREIVLNVYDFMKEEVQEEKRKSARTLAYRKQLLKVQKRVEEATEFSERKSRNNRVVLIERHDI